MLNARSSSPSDCILNANLLRMHTSALAPQDPLEARTNSNRQCYVHEEGTVGVRNCRQHLQSPNVMGLSSAKYGKGDCLLPSTGGPRTSLIKSVMLLIQLYARTSLVEYI